MTDPLVLLFALRDTFRDIPTLVSELGGSVDNIIAHVDQWPEVADVSQAILDMPAGRLLIAWQGTGVEQSTLWRHEFLFAIKGPNEAGLQPPQEPVGATAIWFEMMNGEVASWGMNIRRGRVDPSVDSMPPPIVGRRQLLVGQDSRQDYFEGRIHLTEREDPL